MSSSSLYVIGISLLVLILTVESAYYAYTYDNGKGDEEHCCLVRVRDNFCYATPITRSLLQVNKQCHLSDAPKHGRYGAKKRNDKYLKKIARRLNVQISYDIDDKVLLELTKPLGKDMLDNDLICLASDQNNINLEKCYVELADASDDHDDTSDDHRGHKRRGNRRRHHNLERKKRVVVKKTEEHDNVADDDTNTDAENEIRRIEINQPIRIREGQGLVIRQTYQVNPKNIRPTNRQERQCWSWYRKHTKKIRYNSSKHRKTCINLNDHGERCIHQLVYRSSNNTESNIPRQEKYSTGSFPVGSKLFCGNHSDHSKLIGFHHRDEICFQPNDHVYIEHKFTDIAGLSDVHKNKDTLQLIANNKKLSAEFGNDCNDQTTLVELNEPVKKRKSTTGDKSIKIE